MEKRRLTRRGLLRMACAAGSTITAGGTGLSQLTRLLRKDARAAEIIPRRNPPLIARKAGAGAPNIIVILSDNHRWDAMSNMKHPFVKTPSLDRLCREGVRFDNAFCTTSLCSPSRASFLTGQYAHSHGVKNNLTPWNNENVTFLELLKSAGYDTAFMGKWHMPGALPRLRGVDRFITFTINAGQGRYFDCPLVIDGVETERKGRYLTEDLTGFALDFIRQKRAAPFCLYLAHKATHHKFHPPRELEHLYDGAGLEHLAPEYHSWVTMANGAYFEGMVGPMEKFYRSYYETAVAMDRQIGRILDELDRLDISKNTVVIYASDNGFFWGEHGLLGTGRWAYEESTRIPFIVRYPRLIRRPGRRLGQMVLNVDLAPTVLDIAGIPAPRAMQGTSFKPLLKDGDVKLRTSFNYEYFKDFPYNVPEMHAVRTERFLYIEYKGRRKPELFDIRKDPRTLNNIIGTDEGRAVLPGLKKLLETPALGRTGGAS
jgi:N-acetylglucosamine-6-sulfatase